VSALNPKNPADIDAVEKLAAAPAIRLIERAGEGADR
jgi:hypothetical protein